MVAKALEGKATAKSEVGKVVASSTELVTGVENGAARNRYVGGKMSTWSGSVELELNTRTTLKKRKIDAVESANLESLEVKRGEWRAHSRTGSPYWRTLTERAMTTTRRQLRRQSYHTRTKTGSCAKQEKDNERRK